MTATISFAIVGSGHVSRYHYAAITALGHRGAHLVAVCTRDRSKFKAVESQFGAPCMDYQTLCEHPEVDVIAICTPSGTHAFQALAAAKAGKHLIVEKPMATTLEDADAMIQACEAKQRLLAISFQRRTQPLFRRLKALVDDGLFGKPLMASLVLPYQRTADYFHAAPWRGTWEMDGGGVLINQGIHLIDILVWLWGDPVEMRAMTATRHQRIATEDTAVVMLRFPSGAMATVTATTAVSPGFAHRLELYGTEGGIQIEGDRVVSCRFKDSGRADLFNGGRDGSLAWDQDSKSAGHLAFYENYLDCLTAGTPLICDGREGRRSLAVILKIYALAQTELMA
jgi:UDP-N-acetyl-2-amino-2-deoxyglucuronate dehydrogenase